MNYPTRTPPKPSQKWVDLAALILASGFLSPLLAIRWVGPDAWHSLFADRLRVDGLGFWQAYSQQIALWAQEGRVFPLGQLWWSGVWANLSATQVRVLHFALVIASLSLLVWAVRRFTRSAALSLWIGALALALIQIRDGEDAISSLSGLIQLQFLAGIAVTAFWVSYIRWGGALRLTLAILALYLHLLIYESGWAWIPAILAFLGSPRKSDEVRKAWIAIVGVCALIALMTFAIRWNVVGVDASVRWGSAWSAMARAFVMQIAGLFPFTGAGLGNPFQWTPDYLRIPPFFSLASLGYAGFASVLLWVVIERLGLRETATTPAPESFQSIGTERRALLRASVAMILAQAIGVAVTDRVQAGMPPGWLHPMGYFGVLALAVILGVMTERFAIGLKGASALYRAWGLLVFVLLAQNAVNRASSQVLVTRWTGPREVLEEAIIRRYFASIPQEAKILLSRIDLWASPEFWRLKVGGNREYEDIRSALAQPQLSGNEVLVRYESVGEVGLFVMGRIVSAKTQPNDGEPVEIWADAPAHVLLRYNPHQSSVRLSYRVGEGPPIQDDLVGIKDEFATIPWLAFQLDKKIDLKSLVVETTPR